MIAEHFLEPIEREVCIYLGCRDIGVSEDGLYGTKIGTVLDHVGRAAVAEHVRTGMTARRLRGRRDHLPDTLAA